MDIFNNLLVALLASTAVGMGVSFIIQLGKLFVPKWFPDASADNWRLGLVLLTAVVIMVLNGFGVLVDVAYIEKLAVSLTALGTTVMPLLILFASWVAKATYQNVLKGVWKLGISRSK